ncbi:MAG: hypothetical protein WKG07_09380 [Hymenobacter sp.]
MAGVGVDGLGPTQSAAAKLWALATGHAGRHPAFYSSKINKDVSFSFDFQYIRSSLGALSGLGYIFLSSFPKKPNL